MRQRYFEVIFNILKRQQKKRYRTLTLNNVKSRTWVGQAFCDDSKKTLLVNSMYTSKTNDGAEIGANSTPNYLITN